MTAGRARARHTVADILLTVAPRVRLYSADVFGPRGSTEWRSSCGRLHWVIDVAKCKVVNLSLGEPEQRLQQLPARLQLQRRSRDAYFKDVLVFAASATTTTR